jgi:titin
VSSSEANVISGNGGNGIAVFASQGTQVLSNSIGVAPSGSAALPNADDGIVISDTSGCIVGGAGARNLISGNGGNGVDIINSTGTLISANFIGTDSSGTHPIPNGNDGVLVDSSSGNIIGVSDAGPGNLISGNTVSGVEIQGQAASGNVVQGNLIGPDVSGTKLVADSKQQGNLVGVYLNGAPGNTIGGMSAPARNIISGNHGSDGSGIGIQILGFQAMNNRVTGNYIGTDASGNAALGNDTGIFISGAPANTIGGTPPGEVNVISGNGAIGIQIFGSGAISNQVLGNMIGVDPTGSHTVVPGETAQGILVNSTFYPNGISSGGATVIGGNVISGFAAALEVYAPQSPSNRNPGSLIQGNVIGMDKSGEGVLGNTVGIYINGVPGNTIGGTTAAARNIISGNDTGVYLFGSTASFNVIQGNYIGLDAKGIHPEGNHVGVYLDGATSNLIGGPSPLDRNFIAGNKRSGNDGSTAIFYFANAANNVAENNDIGTNASGKGGPGFGAGDYGVLLFNAANNQPNRLGSRTNRILGSGIAAIREFTGPVKQARSSGTSSGSAPHRTRPHAIVTKNAIPRGPRGVRSRPALVD